MEVVNNKYVSTAITIGLGLYAALLGPNLPTFVKDLFKNTLFRILILFLVIVRGNKDPKMAIMIAVAFILTLDYVHVRDVKENLWNTKPICNSSQELIDGNCVSKCKSDEDRCRPLNSSSSWFSRAESKCYKKCKANEFRNIANCVCIRK